MMSALTPGRDELSEIYAEQYFGDRLLVPCIHLSYETATEILNTTLTVVSLIS